MVTFSRPDGAPPANEQEGKESLKKTLDIIQASMAKRYSLEQGVRMAVIANGGFFAEWIHWAIQFGWFSVFRHLPPHEGEPGPGGIHIPYYKGPKEVAAAYPGWLPDEVRELFAHALDSDFAQRLAEVRSRIQ